MFLNSERAREQKKKNTSILQWNAIQLQFEVAEDGQMQLQVGYKGRPSKTVKQKNNTMYLIFWGKKYRQIKSND